MKPTNAANTSAVAERPTSAVAVPAAGEFEQFAGSGFEGAGRDDMAIPFLSILQSGSPECKRSEGAYIEGAQEGMLLNTVTRQVIDPAKVPVIVVPAAYVRAFIEWRVREGGGGFVREHAPNPDMMAATMLDEKSRNILSNGNQLNDTRSFYVILLAGEDGDMPSPAVMTMTSTQIKKAKQWMMQQNLLKLKGADGRPYTPPMFASKWRVTTVPESNDKGSWFGWAFEHAGYLTGVTDPIFEVAQALHQSVTSGAVKVDMARSTDAGPTTEPAAGEASSTSTGAPSPDDDIPF